MKFTLLLAALLTPCLYADAGDEIGRYQLLPATVDVVTSTAVTQQHVVLKIDTKTGTTWTYAIGESGKSGKMIEFWSEIKNPQLADASR